LKHFDLPLHYLWGTPFQQSVWTALQNIRYGHTTSYADIAQAVARPSAFRAVGAAVGRNPLSVIIPCHRVMGANGALTGYAGGLQRKQHLLQLEAQHA
jgi:methylated-DNA-[protein]-cysteine S-methyltransferase